MKPAETLQFAFDSCGELVTPPMTLEPYSAGSSSRGRTGTPRGPRILNPTQTTSRGLSRAQPGLNDLTRPHATSYAAKRRVQKRYSPAAGALTQPIEDRICPQRAEARGFIDGELMLLIGALAAAVVFAVFLGRADCQASKRQCQKDAALLQLQWRFEWCGCQLRVGDWWVSPRSIGGQP